MNSKAPKNIVASVLARPRNRSQSSGAPFQQGLQQYAIERFLYRVSKSQHAQGVILEGALLLNGRANWRSLWRSFRTVQFSRGLFNHCATPRTM